LIRRRIERLDRAQVRGEFLTEKRVYVVA